MSFDPYTLCHLLFSLEESDMQQEIPKPKASPEIPNHLKYPKYYKDVSKLEALDVYQVHQLFGIDDPSGAIQHASKKLLLSGNRTGGKSKFTDIREARDTLNRWLEMNSPKESV